MSREDVDGLRSHLEAASTVGMRIDVLDDQAIDRVMQVFHPEVEFREDPKFPEGGIYRGRDALRAYFKRFSSEFDRFWWEAEDVLDAGDDRVLALIRVRGRGKGSGAEFDIRGGWLFTMGDGTAVRVNAYLDRREALEAAGLSE
jgi:ketosteroid isomerase-like protein